MPDFYFAGNTVSDFMYQGWYLYYINKVSFLNNRFDFNGTYTTANYTYLYYNDSSIFANNLIQNTSGVVSTFYIYTFYYGMGCKVYHNTYNLNFTGGYGPCMYNVLANGMKVRNNIFRNNSSGYAATYYYNPTVTYKIDADFNNYYSNGVTQIYSATPTATSSSSLNAFRTTYPLMDPNSIAYRPGFMSATNAVPNPADSAVWAINGRGTQLTEPEVALDLSGNPRPTTVADGVPDLGAFEVTPTAAPPALDASPATPSAGSNQYFMFGSDTVARIAWDPFATPPTSIEGRLYSGSKPPFIGTAPYYMNSYLNFTAPAGFYGYTMELRYKDEWLGTIPSETNMVLAKHTNGLWTAYTGTSSTVDTVLNYLSAGGLYDFSDFTGTDNTTPLPVQLGEFNGVRSGNDVLVSWTTASERNSSTFTVERSFNGSSFEGVAVVPAAGTSATTRSYSQVDAGVASARTGVVYYRLLTTDKDGSKEYSRTIAVQLGNRSGVSAIAYPNPFNSSLTVKVVSANDANITFEMCDLQGRVVRSGASSVKAGASHIGIANTSALNSGVYFLTVTDGHDYREVIKVIK
jgi:hypothetical protein